MPRNLRGMMKKLTPVLVVDQIEPVLPLWDALQFSRTVEVPHDNRIGFVICADAAGVRRRAPSCYAWSSNTL
jgi:hypothetical protein